MATDTTMTVARHGFVPAPSTEEVVLTPEVHRVSTSDEGNLVLTAAGVVYLATSPGSRFLSGAKWGGDVAGGLGKLTAKGMQAAYDRTQEKRAQPTGIPAPIQAALKRGRSFAAGFTDVVSVQYKSTWASKVLWLDVTESGETHSHKIGGLNADSHEKMEQLAATIAIRRVLAEGTWVMQEALAHLRSEPAPQRPLADTISATEAVLDALRKLIDGAGVSRKQIAERALRQHPEFAEFESVPAVAEVYSALITG